MMAFLIKIHTELYKKLLNEEDRRYECDVSKEQNRRLEANLGKNAFKANSNG